MSRRGKVSPTIPFLLDVQSDLLKDLTTRVVVPLGRLAEIGKPANLLSPVLEIEGEKFVMLTPELAGIPVKRRGPMAIPSAAKRANIIRAVDVVFSGV